MKQNTFAKSSTHDAQPDIAPSDLINIALLETAFAPEGYHLKSILMDIVARSKGAYHADGCFVAQGEMIANEKTYVEMIYQHCHDLIKVKEKSTDKLFDHLHQGQKNHFAGLVLIDNTEIPYPVSEKIYELHLILERLYWELRQVITKKYFALEQIHNPDAAAEKWLEDEYLCKGRQDENIVRRLSTYADKFKNALLSMKDWFGLYGFSLKKDDAVKCLLASGYEQQKEVIGLPTALVQSIASSTCALRGADVEAKMALSKPRRPYKTGMITLDEAAQLCMVSKGTIQNWEKGRAPEGWPGRADAVELKKFAALYCGRKQTARIIAKAQNPILVDPFKLKDVAKSAFNDD